MGRRYNVPQTLLERVRKIMRMEAEEFQEYLETIIDEAEAYVKGVLLLDFEELDDGIKAILNSFYMQYALYAKIEKDEISQDKLAFLNNYIDGFNQKLEKEKNVAKESGVKFL